MPGDPKECRQHAKRCLELASDAPPSSLTRARFENLARTWLRIARDLEIAKSLLDKWGDPPRRKTG